MKTALFIALMVFAFRAYANAPNYGIHENYQSLRALGMGDAFTAVADDDYAMFYNPAALAKHNGTDLRLFLRGAADQNVIPFYNNLKNAGSDPVQVTNVLNKYYGDDMYFRPTLGGIFVHRHWSLAILPLDFSNNFDLHSSIAGTPSVFVTSILDTTVAYAYGHSARMPFHLPGHLYWGYNLRLVHRASYSDVIQSTELAVNGSKLVDLSNVDEGATVDGDLGLLYDMAEPADAFFRPSFALVVRNVGSYGFVLPVKFFNKSASAPIPYQRVVDFGTKVGLKHFWVFHPKVALDLRDIGNSQWTPLKGLHVGAEFYWKMYNWWQGFWSAGVNQGYWTAGFGARMSVFELEIASWGEEEGTTSATEQSRRYAFEMSMNF